MNLGGITKPVTDLAGKAAKANKIKKISLKIKFNANKNNSDKATQGNVGSGT